MKRFLSFLTGTILLIFSYPLLAQPGCPDINAGPNQTLQCGQNCAQLNATAFQTGGTATYTVSNIPYTPFSYNSGTPILVNDDDIWSCPIALPFTFCYFGQSYNQFIVGSNAVVSFTPQLPCAPPLFVPECTWPIADPVPTATVPDMVNCIMAPWHDIDPSVGGNIYYQVIGQAPCRILVVSWYQTPMFSTGCNNLIATSQAVLYETTNVIEIYIQNKPLCTGWNDGAAIEGIQNANGTVAYTVPNRNYPTQWTAANDAWRFTPSGPSIVSVDWFQGATPIGSGNQVQVCPGQTTDYIAQATYTPCAGGTPVIVRDTVSVALSGSLIAGVDSTHNVSCFGANDGAAYASIDTGTAPISYGWSNGASTLAITGLAPGTYIFTVSDASACTRSDTVVITQPAQLLVTVPDSSYITCGGSAANGNLTAYATGGTPGYGYLWNTTQTAPGITNQPAGTYTVTVTDAALCSASATGHIISIIRPVVLGAPAITAVTCNGGNNGSIAVAVDSATLPVTFSWSNGLPANDTVSNLAAGTYQVTVTDSRGCQATAAYTVNQPAAIAFGTPVITPAGCTTPGGITASASGGTGTITYTWSNGQTGNTQNNLAASSYGVTATDQNGCTASATYTVPSGGNAVIFGQPVIAGIQCYGDSTGSITITPQGNGPLTYNWSNGGNTATISNLGAGSYSVTVTDSTNCSASITYIITQPAAIIIDSSNFTNITCFGFDNGTITVFASGGTGTLQYNWTGGLSGSALTSLDPGTYVLTITDANNCSINRTFTITEPQALLIDSAHVTDYTCNSAGAITLYTSGGTGTLTYAWSNSQTTSSLSNLNPGTYIVTITDQNGCTASESYTIVAVGNVLILNSPVIGNVRCFGGNNGYIVAQSTGGSGTITYTWTGNVVNDTLGNLTAGTYSVTASDQGGCSASATYTVTQPAAFTVSVTTPGLICFGSQTGTASAAVNGGTPGYTYHWNDSAQSTTPTVSNLPWGFIAVTVTDANSCTASGSAVINQTFPISYYRQLDLHVCSDTAYGDLAIYPRYTVGPVTFSVPGVGTYTATMSGSDTVGVFPHVVPGNYNFTITDSLGCTINGTFVIPFSAANDSFLLDVDSTSCFGNVNDGAITITPVSVQDGPFQYSLNGGPYQDDSVFTNLAGGTYTITAKNNYGCGTTLTAVVGQPAAIGVNASPDTIITSPGLSNQITVSTTNVTNPVFSWNPATGLSCSNCSNPLATVDSNTLYFVTVSDSINRGCSSYDSVYIIVGGNVRMPNAFTPNGDGRNDLFAPVAPGLATIKEFRIYNRWGQLVHNSADGWDGRFSGKDQPVGTYVYYVVIQVPDADNPGSNKNVAQQGSFTLLR